MEEVIKILIADDNKAIVEIMRGKIEKDKRYKVIGIAYDVEKEIEIIENLKPDVVITDIRKKNEWSGLDVIETYKDKEYKPIFFVVSSSINYNVMRNMNIRYYLAKPYADENFFHKLEEIYYEKYPKHLIELKADVLIKENNILWKIFEIIKKRIVR